MPSPTVNAHSAVQAPRKLSWARRRLGLRALLLNAAAALPSLPSASLRTESLSTFSRSDRRGADVVHRSHGKA